MSEKRKAPSTAFKPGQSGNPRGKPKGAINRTTRLALALFEGDIENIADVVIQQAKDGDLTAARLVLDKLVPNAKERMVALPEWPDTSTTAGIAEAQQRILEAIAAGELTPGEGNTLAGIVEARRRAVETQDLEQRISALEAKK